MNTQNARTIDSCRAIAEAADLRNFNALKEGDKVVTDDGPAIITYIQHAKSGKPFELDGLRALSLIGKGEHVWSTGGYFPNMRPLFVRDATATRLGALNHRVGIAWQWVEGFPSAVTATEYVEHVKRAEKRERVYAEFESNTERFTVAIHF